MSFDEIKQGLEEIESEIFAYSLHKNLCLEQLVEIYRRLLEFKDRLLELSFNGTEIDKLEKIRFCLLEEAYMIRIFIKERVGQDNTKEIDKLKHLYKNNEK